MTSLPSLAINFSTSSQTVRVRCILPDFNFLLQSEKQTSVLFFCGWEAFKDYFVNLVLTRLPRKNHISPRYTPMWATFFTFQKVLKSVWVTMKHFGLTEPTASYQQSDGMQHQQCTKEMGVSMTLHTFMPQHLLLLMMRCAFSWGKISCGFTPMHRGINQLISHRMVMNKRKLV